MSDTANFDAVTDRFALPLLFAAQAGKEIVHNEALARIDALMHGAVLGERDTPPPSPATGDCWLVSSVPAGPWSGHPGAIAIFQNGAWLFAQPMPGMRIFNRSTRQFTVFCDEWRIPSLFEEPTGGMHVDAEARVAIRAIVSALKAAGIYPAA
jgi:hypothetical protein